MFLFSILINHQLLLDHAIHLHTPFIGFCDCGLYFHIQDLLRISTFTRSRAPLNILIQRITRSLNNLLNDRSDIAYLFLLTNPYKPSAVIVNSLLTILISHLVGLYNISIMLFIEVLEITNIVCHCFPHQQEAIASEQIRCYI